LLGHFLESFRSQLIVHSTSKGKIVYDDTVVKSYEKY